MYGTIFRLKVKDGKEEELLGLFDKWERDLKPRFTGVAGSLLLKSDNAPGEFWGVAVFKDKNSYTGNAKDLEQDKWYRQMRRLLQSDPEWNDGKYVFTRIY